METTTAAVVPEAVTTALTTGLNGIGTAMTNIIATVLPIGLPIAGVVMAVKFGFRFFRSVSAA